MKLEVGRGGKSVLASEENPECLRKKVNFSKMKKNEAISRRTSRGFQTDTTSSGSVFTAVPHEAGAFNVMETETWETLQLAGRREFRDKEKETRQTERKKHDGK